MEPIIPNEKDKPRRPWPHVALGAIVLLIALELGAGPVAGNLDDAAATVPVCGPDAAEATTPPASAAAPAREAVFVPVPETAYVTATESGAVAFYFADGSAQLPAGAADALAEVVKGVATGKKAVVLGAPGSANDLAADELSQQRMLAVQGALTALGIGPDKLELRRPPAAAASSASSAAPPRRVEVMLE